MPRRSHRRGPEAVTLLLAVLTAAALAGAACSGDDDSAAPSTSPPTSSAPTSVTTTVPVAPADQSGTVDQTPPIGTNGIVATADRIFVADLRGNQIVGADPATGAITARWGEAEGIVSPDDVALGPDGAIYFTSYMTGGIGRIAPDGSVTEIANVGAGANPIAFSDDGRLFVGRAVVADGLYEVDPTGEDAQRTIAETVGNVNAFAVGTDGAIYGPRFGLAGAGAVVRIDVESGAVTEVAAGLDYPVSVRFTADDELLVAQVNPPSILRLDRSDGSFSSVAAIPHPIDNFAVAADGRLFVTSFDQSTVSEVADDGTVRTFTLGRS